MVTVAGTLLLCSTALGDSRGEAEQRVPREASAEGSECQGKLAQQRRAVSAADREECTGGLAEEKTGDRVSPRPFGTGWKASRVAVRGADLEEEGAAELGWRIPSPRLSSD